MNKKVVVFIFSVFLFIGCYSDLDDLFDLNAERIPIEIIGEVSFADPNLVQEARNLHTRLQAITQKGIAFGQQGAFSSGNGNNPNTLESDFLDVANDYPAVIGFELAGLELIDPLNPDPFIIRDNRKDLIIKAHENGSIITATWHTTNPITNENSFDLVRAVPEMLENGTHRDIFLLYLERLARFFNDLKDANGNPIPVLFRPWHEMNGDFFYWGEGLRTTEEFKQLYRDTVRILSEDYNVHNLLYVYSPNWFSKNSEYLRNYPGDDYVDMLGVDIYDFKNGKFLNNALKNLNFVENIARDKNMLFALTETGLENLTQNDWWTEKLYRAVKSSGMTYTMVWRNVRNATRSNIYVPYIGHPSEDDFKEFITKDVILLNNDINF